MAIRAGGERTRITTTLDAHVLSDLKKHCEENNLSISVILDALIVDYLNGDTKHKGADIMAKMLSDPIIVNLVLDVILPEIKTRIEVLDKVFKNAKEKSE